MLDDAWFAGFVDGEGCFFVATKHRHGTVERQPRLTVGLRADDMAVLVALQKVFGGSLRIETELRGNRRNRVMWEVVKKSDLARLATYFRRFPLRAKKAAEAHIWCQAVDIYVATSSKAPALEAFDLALREAKKYPEDTPAVVVPLRAVSA